MVLEVFFLILRVMLGFIIKIQCKFNTREPRSSGIREPVTLLQTSTVKASPSSLKRDVGPRDLSWPQQLVRNMEQVLLGRLEKNRQGPQVPHSNVRSKRRWDMQRLSRNPLSGFPTELWSWVLLVCVRLGFLLLFSVCLLLRYIGKSPPGFWNTEVNGKFVGEIWKLALEKTIL